MTMAKCRPLAASVVWFGAAAVAGALVSGCGGVSGSRLYARARAASVEVLVAGRMEGSGWVANGREGLVVTAGHVMNSLKPKAAIEVVSPVAGRMKGRCIALDRGHDLALIRIEGKHPVLPALRVASAMPPPTTPIYLFGAPMFRHQILITGAMTQPKPTYEFLGDKLGYVLIYHVDGPAPKGVSGGPWMDADGRVVGNQSGYMCLDNAQVGLADIVGCKAIRTMLRRQTSAHTPTLRCAVEELDEQDVHYIARFPAGTTGLVPVAIAKGGPAAKAGLSRDTLITAIDGRPVANRNDFMAAVRKHKVGDEITLRVLVLPKAKHKAKAKAQPKVQPRSKPAPLAVRQIQVRLARLEE